jgi:hypothetical protein
MADTVALLAGVNVRLLRANRCDSCDMSLSGFVLVCHHEGAQVFRQITFSLGQNRVPEPVQNFCCPEFRLLKQTGVYQKGLVACKAARALIDKN